MTHLNDLSKVYKEQIASQETQEEGYKPIDKEKENKMYRRAGNLARTSLLLRVRRKKMLRINPQRLYLQLLVRKRMSVLLKWVMREQEATIRKK